MVTQSAGRLHRPALNNPLASPDFAPVIFAIPSKHKASEIVEEARQLPYGERAELIEQLIADNAKDLDPKIDRAWGDEVMRRLKEIEEGKVQLIPGDQVAAKIRKIVGRQ